MAFNEKKRKNTHAYKKPSPQKREALKKGAPTIQNRTYRIVTKDLRNQSLKGNIVTNKGPNITRISL